MASPARLQLLEWIKENEHLLKPPVNNQMMYAGDDFIVMVVGGPEPADRLPRRPVRGVVLPGQREHARQRLEDGRPAPCTSARARSGCCRGTLPHSPQRPEAGSIGIVIERIREEGTLEKFQWYCPNCNALVHEVELQVRDIVEDLPPVFEAFYGDEQARTCPHCGTVHPGKG